MAAGDTSALIKLYGVSTGDGSATSRPYGKVMKLGDAAHERRQASVSTAARCTGTTSPLTALTTPIDCILFDEGWATIIKRPKQP